MKKISLISTTFNEESNILNFLESYKRQTRHADEYVIVDGGSSDKTAEIIQTFADENPELNIKLIVDKTCSKKYSTGPIAKGRNVAIRNAQYDYIAATDAGCVLRNNWFEELVSPWENDDTIDVISGWYDGIVENDFQKIYNKIYMPKLEKIDRESFLPSARNIAFKKSCWEHVGGYPEKTYTAEDNIYDINLKKAGYKFYFNEKAVVSWELPKSLKETCNKVYNYGIGGGEYNYYGVNMYLCRILYLICPIPLLFQDYPVIKYKVRLAHFFGYTKGLFKRLTNYSFYKSK